MAVNAAGGLFLVPLIISRVGMDGFGVWVLIAQVLSYVTVLNNGLMLAVNRLTAYHRGDTPQVNRFVSASFSVLLSAGVLVVGLSVAFSSLLVRVFPSIPAELAGDARAVCVLVACTLCLTMVGSTFGGVLRGYQRYVHFNVVASLGVVLRVTLTMVALGMAQSIVAVQAAALAAALVTSALMLIVARRLVRGLSIVPFSTDRSALSELLAHTRHSAARTGSTLILYSTMTLLVGRWGSVSDVAAFSIASRIPHYLRTFLTGAQSVFLPAITALYAKRKLAELKSLVGTGTRVSIALTIFSSLLLFVYAESILSFWLKGNVTAGTVLVLRVLILAVVPGGAFDIWMSALVGLGILRGLTWASVATTVCSIGLAVVLLSVGDLPVAMAPAVALAAGLWAKSGFWLPAYALRKLGMRFAVYMRTCILPAIAAGIASALILFPLSRVSFAPGLPGFALKFAVSAAILAVLFGVVVLWRDRGSLLSWLVKR